MSATLAPGTRVQAVLADEARTELPDMVGTVVPVTEWPHSMPEQWTDENTIIVRWDDTEGRKRFTPYAPDVANRVLRVLDDSLDAPVPVDLAPRASSVAGLGALRYGRIAPKSTSTGAVTQPNPAPVDAPTCTCHPVPERYHTTHYGATEPGSTLEPDYDCPVHFPATTHILDRIPGEPNPLDVDPAYGFTAAVDVDSGVTWYERPTIWLTREQYAALGEPQQVEVTVKAVAL